MFYLLLPLIFEWRINFCLILDMDILPILLEILLKEIPPTYHSVLQDESWALQCHKRKILTHLLRDLLAGQTGLSDLPCSCPVTMMCTFIGTMVEWWLHSSSVSDFILGFQPSPSLLPSSLSSSNFQNPTACFLTGVSMTTSVCGGVDSSTPFHLSFVALSLAFLNNPGSSLFLYCAWLWPSLSVFKAHINEFCSQINQRESES